MNQKDLRKLKGIVAKIEDLVPERMANVWMRKQAHGENQETACRERVTLAYENCKEMILREFPEIREKGGDNDKIDYPVKRKTERAS